MLNFDHCLNIGDDPNGDGVSPPLQPYGGEKRSHQRRSKRSIVSLGSISSFFSTIYKGIKYGVEGFGLVNIFTKDLADTKENVNRLAQTQHNNDENDGDDGDGVSKEELISLLANVSKQNQELVEAVIMKGDRAAGAIVIPWYQSHWLPILLALCLLNLFIFFLFQRNTTTSSVEMVRQQTHAMQRQQIERRQLRRSSRSRSPTNQRRRRSRRRRSGSSSVGTISITPPNVAIGH